jgi:hypothetical protein
LGVDGARTSSIAFRSVAPADRQAGGKRRTRKMTRLKTRIGTTSRL